MEIRFYIFYALALMENWAWPKGGHPASFGEDAKSLAKTHLKTPPLENQSKF